jgi:hypothetical protein
MRIKASEIRLGNYLIIDGIQECLTGQKMSNLLLNDYDLESIQLTEEWLIKFGFKCTIIEEYPVYFKDFMSIEYYEGMSILYVGPCDGFEINICSVHELQNIYHSLSNKELI